MDNVEVVNVIKRPGGNGDAEIRKLSLETGFGTFYTVQNRGSGFYFMTLPEAYAFCVGRRWISACQDPFHFSSERFSEAWASEGKK
ncbi:MAG: hypothetical protein FWC62_05620 [Firmicutes bacterium]|nr:hypothetical protein [Bacillota bacterium]